MVQWQTINMEQAIVTEQDWLTSTNPAEMGEFLLGRPGATYSGVGGLNPQKRISDRKMRLYCAAASGMSKNNPDLFKESWVKWADLSEDHDTCSGFTTLGGFNYWNITPNDIAPPAVRANILRDLVGNPFRPVKSKYHTITYPDGTYKYNVPVLDKQLTPPTVLSLATAVYENLLDYNRLDNDRLLVLSDSLEESGCVDPAVLNHLRGCCDFPGCTEGWIIRTDGRIGADPCRRCRDVNGNLTISVHFKGCWVIDLILGLD